MHGDFKVNAGSILAFRLRCFETMHTDATVLHIDEDDSNAAFRKSIFKSEKDLTGIYIYIFICHNIF